MLRSECVINASTDGILGRVDNCRAVIRLCSDETLSSETQFPVCSRRCNNQTLVIGEALHAS